MALPFSTRLPHSSLVVGGLSSAAPGRGLDTWLHIIARPQQAGPGFAAWWHDPEEECESVPSLPLHGTGQSKSQGQSFFQGWKEFPSLNTLNGRMCKLTLQRAWPEGSVKSRLCFPPIYCFKPGSGRAVCGASTVPSFASADSSPC